jgi:hypothetical protein
MTPNFRLSTNLQRSERRELLPYESHEGDRCYDFLNIFAEKIGIVLFKLLQVFAKI